MRSFTSHTDEIPEAPRRRWRRAAVVLLLLALGGLAWLLRPDPRLARAKELQKELFSGQAKNLSPDERKAKFTEFREQVKQLTADQKWELSAPMRERQKAEMDRYFALSPREKAKYLDERIDRSEKMRREREQKQKSGQRQAGGRPGAGSGFGPGGGGFGAPGGTPRSAEEIEKRRREFLNRTTPEERARMDQFRKQMNDRRRQRGLPVRT